jgi:hypothetical protein
LRVRSTEQRCKRKNKYHRIFFSLSYSQHPCDILFLQFIDKSNEKVLSIIEIEIEIVDTQSLTCCLGGNPWRIVFEDLAKETKNGNFIREFHRKKHQFYET